MNENLNLCEILKGLEGIELYSTVFGNVILQSVDSNSVYVHVKKKEQDVFIYNSTGIYICYTDAECTLFPSKDQRDWSKFERPIPANTPMMFASCHKGVWRLGYYARKSSKGYHLCFAEGKTSHSWATYVTDNYYPYMIPFDKFDPNNIEESLKYNIQK